MENLKEKKKIYILCIIVLQKQRKDYIIQRERENNFTQSPQ
jgi:hypothetical protein